MVPSPIATDSPNKSSADLSSAVSFATCVHDARVVRRAHLEEVHDTRFRIFIGCSNDGDTIVDCSGLTELIIRCSVISFP